MKAAFVYWDNRIAPVFDVARKNLIVEAESGHIVRETQDTLPEIIRAWGRGTLRGGAFSRMTVDHSGRKEDNIMPGRDGTGPRGLGALTGRGAGPCSGASTPGFLPGRGFGPGFGPGRGAGGAGWRHRFFATGLPGWMRFGEKQALKNQAEALQSELDFIKKRLEDIEDGDETK
jgi:hypothetical protein